MKIFKKMPALIFILFYVHSTISGQTNFHGELYEQGRSQGLFRTYSKTSTGKKLENYTNWNSFYGMIISYQKVLAIREYEILAEYTASPIDGENVLSYYTSKYGDVYNFVYYNDSLRIKLTLSLTYQHARTSSSYYLNSKKFKDWDEAKKQWNALMRTYKGQECP